MKASTLLIVFILIILFAANVLGVVIITGDNFDGSVIDAAKWDYYQTGNINFNLSNGNYIFNGVPLSSLWIEGNTSAGGSATNCTTLKTISYLNSTTNGSIETDALITANDVSTVSAYIFGLGNYTYGASNNWIGSSSGWCGIYIQWTHYNGLAFIEHTKTTGGTTLYTIQYPANFDNDVHHVEITATRTTNSTTFKGYYDDVLVTTHVQNTTCKLYGLYSAFGSTNVYQNFMFFDNFIMYSDLPGLAEGTYPVGTWVGFESNHCLTGYAEYGKCSLKPAGETCLLDNECLSGACAGGKCNSPGAWSSMDNFVKLTFGSDTTSLTFISVAIILMLMGGIIFVAKGSIAGIIAGTGVMIMTMIFFTIVGWLPAFFIIGLVLLIIISIALMLVLR